MQNNKELLEEYSDIMMKKMAVIFAEEFTKIIDERVPKIIDERVPKIIDERVPKIIDERVPQIIEEMVPKIVDERVTKSDRRINRKINDLKAMDESILDEVERLHDIMDKRLGDMDERLMLHSI